MYCDPAKNEKLGSNLVKISASCESAPFFLKLGTQQPVDGYL